MHLYALTAIATAASYVVGAIALQRGSRREDGKPRACRVASALRFITDVLRLRGVGAALFEQAHLVALNVAVRFAMMLTLIVLIQLECDEFIQILLRGSVLGGAYAVYEFFLRSLRISIGLRNANKALDAGADAEVYQAPLSPAILQIFALDWWLFDRTIDRFWLAMERRAGTLEQNMRSAVRGRANSRNEIAQAFRQILSENLELVVRRMKRRRTHRGLVRRIEEWSSRPVMEWTRATEQQFGLIFWTLARTLGIGRLRRELASRVEFDAALPVGKTSTRALHAAEVVCGVLAVALLAPSISASSPPRSEGAGGTWWGTDTIVGASFAALAFLAWWFRIAQEKR